MRKKADILVVGGPLLTMDRQGTRFDPGAVAVVGDSIAAVGGAEEIEKEFSPVERVHLPRSIVMPGLVNAHTHAAMTCFRGLADDLPLMTWLNDYIFPAEARNVDPDLVFWGSLLGCAEMIRSGTTTFSDMYIFEEETARAARQAGLRCRLGEVLFDFPSPNAATPAEGLAYTEAMLQKWAGDPLVNIMVEPHSLYTCSSHLLEAAGDLAARYRVPLATHLLENRGEITDIRKNLGQEATEFLLRSGLLNERLIAFHCVAVDERDIGRLSEHGCKVVHNPRSNMKLASGVAPVTAMLRRGITVGLGTDGCASNNILDMFIEMDSAAKLEKSSRLDPTIMDSATVLRMATIDGAAVLGLEQDVGSLEPGKKADICIVDMEKPHLTPMYNPASHLVHAVSGSDVDTVIVNGRVLMRNRRLTTINEQEVMARVREIAARIGRDQGRSPA